MSAQPVIDLPPSIPPPQTVISLLQHQSSIPPLNGMPPGEIPVMELHMARSTLIDSLSLSTSDAPGTTLSDREFPFVPSTNIQGSTIASDSRFAYAYPQQLYFTHGVYWNAQADYKLWAVKAPAAVGRLRIVYRPPMPYSASNVYDNSQRDIMKEWDFSADNQFTFSIRGFNMRNFRSTTATALLNTSTVSANIHIPLNDYKFGYYKTSVTNRYQPGGIFPETAQIYVFQSFSNCQFKILRAPPLIREESALTTLFNSDL